MCAQFASRVSQSGDWAESVAAAIWSMSPRPEGVAGVADGGGGEHLVSFLTDEWGC